MTINEKYQEKCAQPSDINENLPVLKKYASECTHVTEMGVRSIVSTWALLAAQPKNLVSIDLLHPSVYGGNLQEVAVVAKSEGIAFKFIEGNTLELDIDSTDLLFIDTFHSYIHLLTELKRFESKVKKYIVLHDTEAFGRKDQGDNIVNDSRMDAINKMVGIEKEGLMTAVEDFLLTNKYWEVAEVLTNNNGMTVLKRKADTPKYTVLIPYLSEIHGIPNRCIDMCKEYLHRNSTYPFELLEAVDYPDYYLAVNDTFMKASTDIVILFNDDMFVEPGWDELYVKYTKPKTAISGYLVESGRIAVGGGAIEADCGRDPENFDYNKFINFIKEYKISANIPEVAPILGHAAPCALHKESWIPFEIVPGMVNNSSGVDGKYFWETLPQAGFTYSKINSFVYHIQSFTSKPSI